MNPSRYHPALVVLHWLLAVLIIASLVLGMFVLKTIPNASPEKVNALRAHMTGGIAILALMSVRFVIRVWTTKPDPASTGSGFLDRIAVLSHYGFYVLILLMAATGIATAMLAALPAIVFGDSGASLPETFSVFPTRIVHGVLAKLILGLIGLHLLGALYHQVIRGDGLLRRMWFGKR